MENNKVVEMFDSIPKFETYSKYSISLQRIFKNNSLKNLIKDLKSPKKIHELKNEKNKNGSEGKYFTDNINDLDDKIFVKIKEKENDDFFDVKFDIKQKKLMKKNKSLKEIRHEKIIQKKKSILPDYPDPYKYHPNYNAIYKKVPSFKFIRPINYTSPLKKKKEELNIESLEQSNKKKYKIPNLKQNIMLTNLETENHYNNNNNYNNNSNENNYMHNQINLTTNPNENNNINNTEGKLNKSKSQNKNLYKKLLPPITKDNHALKFSQYTWRKFIIPESSDKLTYLEPINYLENINKVIDFNKMNSRKELINNPSNLENPSICYYKPKYDFIEKNPSIVSFGNFNENKKTKKFLLKKLWGSYNFTSEYQLIDNNKLNQVKINE